MAENTENAKDNEEEASSDKPVDQTSPVKEKESESIGSNKDDIEEEDTNEKTETECQEDAGDVESSVKKKSDNFLASIFVIGTLFLFGVFHVTSALLAFSFSLFVDIFFHNIVRVATY